MAWIKNFLYYPLIDSEGFILAPINLVVFILLFLAGKLSLKYLRNLFKAQELDQKRLTVEGKEIPVWRLTRQLLWLVIVIIGFKTLDITNPDLAASSILTHEFIRFKEFHVAVYHFFVVVIIFFAGRIVLSLIRLYLSRRIKSKTPDEDGSMYVYLQLTKYIIITLSIIFVLRSMGVDLNLFLTSMAFLLVGIGLGLQDVFRDFFSGLLLLFEGSVKVGDIVEIDRTKDDNFIARIIEINLRTSKVETIDGKRLIVPNSQLTFQSVNNWTSGNKATRFFIPVTVAYGSDLELVRTLMTKCAKSHPRVVKHKDVIVRLRAFGQNGYEMDLVFWANQNFYIDIHKSEICFAIDAAFRANGIKYPYPQLDLHVIPPSSPSDVETQIDSDEEKQ